MPSDRLRRALAVLTVVAATGTAETISALDSQGAVPRPVLRLGLGGPPAIANT